MRKIMNGKMYNTETATKIAEYERDCSPYDFTWFKEVLYRKRTGEFFKHGHGNAASPYCEYSYGSYGSGERIVPLKEAEAKQWLETKSDVDTYISVFGMPEE